MIVVNVILALLCILLMAVVALFFFPLRYEFKAESDSPMTVQGKAGWLGKIFRIRFSYIEGKPVYKEVYVGGKLKAGNEKDYQEWLERKVMEEFEAEDAESVEEFEKRANSEELKNNFGNYERESEVKVTESIDDRSNQSVEPIEQNMEKEMNVEPEPAKQEKKSVKDEDKVTDSEKNADEIDKRWWLTYVKRWETYEAILHLLSRIYNHSKPRRVRISGVFGTGDPAETGMLAGLLYSIWPEHLTEIEFDFIDVSYTGKLFMCGRIIPAFLVWYLISFAWGTPIRSIIIDGYKHRP